MKLIMVALLGLTAGYYLSQFALLVLYAILFVLWLLWAILSWFNAEMRGRPNDLDSAVYLFICLYIFIVSSLVMGMVAPTLDSPEALLKVKKKVLDWLLRK